MGAWSTDSKTNVATMGVDDFRSNEGAVRRGQGYEGTDRKVRGDILQRLRDAPNSLPRQEFDDIDPAEGRIDRLLHALITEGFVEPLPNNGNRFRLTR